MPDLIALDLPPGDEFVAAVREVWEGGHAALPIDQRLPEPARRRLFDQLRPTHVWSAGSRGALDGGEGVEPGDALVVRTSGTSGEPKGVVLTMAAVREAAMLTSDALDATIDDDRWLLCLPVAHMGGLSVVTRSIVTGVPITTLPGFDRLAVETAALRGATLVSLVPAALEGLDASLFRTILLGGSAMPPDRPANTVATYGLTETGGGVVYDGRPLPGVEVRIVDGEIQLRTPTSLRTYRFGDDPRTPDGWLPTGDLGELTDDGVLRVSGRRDELIVTGGQNVFPTEVEAALRSHRQIAEVAVVGRPDDRWGTAVTAVVVPADRNDPPDLDTVRGWAKAQLPSYAAPTRLELVEELPTTPLGKVLRRKL